MNRPRTTTGIVDARKRRAASLARTEDTETNEVFEPDEHGWADELADEDDIAPASFPDSRPDVVELKDGQDEDESARAPVPSPGDASESSGTSASEIASQGRAESTADRSGVVEGQGLAPIVLSLPARRSAAPEETDRDRLWKAIADRDAKACGALASRVLASESPLRGPREQSLYLLYVQVFKGKVAAFNKLRSLDLPTPTFAMELSA